MNDDQEIAIQSRCIHCLGEHYVLNQLAVSYGDAGCHHCGRKSRQMTRDEYIEALTAAREKQVIE